MEQVAGEGKRAQGPGADCAGRVPGQPGHPGRPAAEAPAAAKEIGPTGPEPSGRHEIDGELTLESWSRRVVEHYSKTQAG